MCGMTEQMIVTPCPSCGGKTLFVGSGGHLTCSWLECKEPVVRIAIAKLKRATDALSVLDARYVADELETRFRMADAPNALRAYADALEESGK